VKQFIAPMALAAALALAAPAQAAPVAASPSAQAQALILIPLTLTKIDNLSFGTIIPSTSSLGTVTIPADGSARTAAGGITLITSDPGLRARFAGAGTPNQNVFINVTNPGTLSNGLGDIVTVLSLTLDRPALVKIDATHAFFFYVGGILQIAANQPEGVYQANFDVTADYL
jgi:hypothetical protein